MIAETENTETNSTKEHKEKTEKGKINYHSLIDLDALDLLGNKKYVDILENKVKTCNSKIVGLMGSWGSGKSSIIYTLEKRLLSTSGTEHIFMIHDAWKYHGDSFKRSFILDLEKNIKLNNSKLRDKKWYEKIWNFFVKARNGFREETIEEILYRQKNYTVNFRSINVISFTIFTIIIIIGLYYFLENPAFDYKILALPTFFTLLTFLLASFNIFSRSSSLTTINSPLSKAEEFEKVYEKLILKIKKGVKLIIVIDNIDRCTSDVAYDILSNVKTFFHSETSKNNHKVIFIVPVDHFMLKSHLKKSFNYSNWDTNCFFKKIFDDVYYLNNYNVDQHIELAKNYCKENNISRSYSFFELVEKLSISKPRDIIEFTKDVSEEISILERSLGSELVNENDYIIAILYYIKQHNEELLIKINLASNLYNMECEKEYQLCINYLNDLPISLVKTFITALSNKTSHDAKGLVDVITNLDKDNFNTFYIASPSKIVSLINNSMPEFKQKGLELLINQILNIKELRHYREIAKAHSDIFNDIKDYYLVESFVKFAFFCGEKERHYFFRCLAEHIRKGSFDFDLTKYVLIHCNNTSFLINESSSIINNILKEINLKNIVEIPIEKLKLLDFENHFDDIFKKFFSNNLESEVFDYLLTNSSDNYLIDMYKRNNTKLNIFEFFLLHCLESSHFLANMELTEKFLTLLSRILLEFSFTSKDDTIWTYFKNNGILSNFVRQLLDSYNNNKVLYVLESLPKGYKECIIDFMNLSLVVSQENNDDLSLWYNFYSQLSNENEHNEIMIYGYFKKISQFKDINTFGQILNDSYRKEWFKKDCINNKKLTINQLKNIFTQK